MASLPDIGLGCANLLGLGLADFIEVARAAGFRCISARPHAFAEALRQGHDGAALRGMLADAGIDVTMIDGLNRGLPGVPGPETLSPEVRAVMPPDVLDPPDEATSLRAASVLGAGVLNVIAYRGEVVPVEDMGRAIAGICRRAAPLGVAIAIEFLPESGIPDIGHAMRVIEACGEPNCGLTLDLFHHGRAGGSVADIARLPARTVLGIQFSDCRRGHSHEAMGGRLMPGEGSLPLVEMVGAALDNNSAAPLDIEVLDAGLRALPPLEAARRLADAAAAWRETFERQAR